MALTPVQIVESLILLATANDGMGRACRNVECGGQQCSKCILFSSNSDVKNLKQTKELMLRRSHTDE